DAEAGQQRTEDRPLTEPLHRECGAADADKPARHRELLARPVPAAAIPDTGRRAVRGQIDSICFVHAAAGCKFGCSRPRKCHLMEFPTRDVIAATAAGLPGG